ncbi:hypothetical protein J6T21_02750 [Candidatus Saccharibacteria bacterium]|nr:hypothetical protein [Candidatus Saccharibacteria bacterium]
MKDRRIKNCEKHLCDTYGDAPIGYQGVERTLSIADKIELMELDDSIMHAESESEGPGYHSVGSRKIYV